MRTQATGRLSARPATMRFVCLPAAALEVYEPAPEWVVFASPRWELEVVAARDGRTVAYWLTALGTRVASVEVGRA